LIRMLVGFALATSSQAHAGRFGAVAPARADRLRFSISLTEGEHSRDSNSTLTSFTFDGAKLKYDRTYSGYRASKRPAEHREIDLAGDEIRRLTELIRAKTLLASRNLRYPIEGGGRYCELTISIDLNRRKALVRISGLLDRLAGENLYTASRAFVQEVEAILENHDGHGNGDRPGLAR